MSDFDPSEYQVVSGEKVTVTKVLTDMWVRLGRPSDPLSEQGSKLVDILISTWADLFPKEEREWVKMRSDYQESEMDIKEQLKKHTGRSLAAYPMYFYQMMKRLFPGFDIAQRDNAILMVKKWPIFRMANRV